jgi:hypothetical protein
VSAAFANIFLIFGKDSNKRARKTKLASVFFANAK